MNRIKFMQGYWELSPSSNSFKEYDTQVLINRMFTMYTLGTDGEVKMLHPFQILDIIVDKQAGIDFKQALFDLVNNLSGNDWHKVCDYLKINKGNGNA